jgi:hypothetical protein
MWELPAGVAVNSRMQSSSWADTTVPLHLQIAIEGCCHGELDTIYSTLQYLEQKEGKKIDLLICCGDFQVQHHA